MELLDPFLPLLEFALRPKWAIDYVTHERFALPQLEGHVDFGGDAVSIGRYFTEMLDPSMTWDDVARRTRGVYEAVA